MKNDIIEETHCFNDCWPAQKANDWYDKNGWIVGCNYIPATAVNQLEMWQAETFDPFVIDKELTWAASLGFNTIRVFLHHLVWQQDPQAYLRRIDYFLGIAFKHGIKTIPVLFDSVWNPDPKPGKQPDPVPHVHNSGWVQCPGFSILNNPDGYDELYSYVRDIIVYFKNDERVLIWDLFNEPDNMNVDSYNDSNYSRPKEELSLQLLMKTVLWARRIEPVQPITMAPWKWANMHSLSELDRYMFMHSDVISFHCYENEYGMEERIRCMREFGRPVICTEYMARGLDSTFKNILPVLKKYNVGACNWGLVQGKSQANYPWDSWQVDYATAPELWFHDIFRTNGEPYDPTETELLKALTHKDMLQEQKVA